MTFLFGRNFWIFLFLDFLWNSSSLNYKYQPGPLISQHINKHAVQVAVLHVCDLILTVAGDNEEGCTEADSIFEGILFIVRII